VTAYLSGATEVVALTGGYHHAVWLATQPDGRQVVVKTTEGAPPGMFAAEAEGLTVLRESGAVSAPRVLDVADAHLVLERLDPLPEGDEDYWERAGHALAALHGVRHDRFGWHADNWLGPTRQYNEWNADGYEFFAERRILRYLAEPRVAEALDAADRRGVERVCARLGELVPPDRPALTHGDLWVGNMLSDAGAPAFIDPAVSYNWPAVDVSMMLFTRPVPARFFDAYHEVLPPHQGWREHARVLHLREHLCVLAQGMSIDGTAGKVRDTVAAYG
jgi:fructosamine-3-kinase